MKYTMQNGKTLLIVSGGSIDINFSKEYIKDKTTKTQVTNIMITLFLQIPFANLSIIPSIRIIFYYEV